MASFRGVIPRGYLKTEIGTLSLFNLYVALSRSSGSDLIRLLRDFKDELFRALHDPALTTEDERLENLDKITQEWYQYLFPGQAIGQGQL